MGFKKWVFSECNKELAKELSYECDIDPIAALIASARGYSDISELEQFLSDDPMFSDPHEMTDIETAADCIKNAVADGVRIAVFGDYDCDGVTATVIMYDYLKSIGADCFYYIPNRESEGYGMNRAAVDYIKNKGAGLIITVDNGISCIDEIDYASSLDIKTVVTDHHIPKATLPNAVAVVDPHRADCPSSFKEICGAQVAFKLICVLEDKEPEELLPRYADLLAIATVGDVMPLNYENRSTVKIGLNKIRTNPRTGIAALMSVAALNRNEINSTKVAFGIVPRINAAGRIGSADTAVELLLCTDMLKALEIADGIDKQNSERQSLEKKIFSQAVNIIEKNGYNHDRVIVVCGEDWHGGVVGISASRIMEKYGKPTIVLSADGENCSGSGRSYSGFSLFDAINECSDLLTKFGGHELAAGLSLELSNLDDFRKRINDYAHTLKYEPPCLHLDCRLKPAAISTDVADAVKELEPFGNGNPVPIFCITECKLQKITPIGSGKHLKLLFAKDGSSFQALLFGVTTQNFCFECDDTLDVAFTLDTNTYNGNYTVSVRVKALRPSGINDDELFAEVASVDDYYSGYDTDNALITPSREDVGSVYRLAVSGGYSKEAITYRLINKVGYAKTEIAIQTLKEINLILQDENGLINGIKTSVKTDLMKSETYKKLAGGGINNDI